MIQINRNGYHRTGNEYSVTIICDLTKYLVILTYGTMKTLISNMGTEYQNSTLTEPCTQLKIKMLTSTAYHHQTLGTTEKRHRTFNEYVRLYISVDITD